MKVLIIGFGISGKSACKLLKKLGYTISIVEDDRKINNSDIDRLLCGLSFVVVSPGVKPDSPIVKRAKELGINVVGELELGCAHLSGKLVAVTGTNGKTTTTSLIGKLLEGNNTFVGGNIGTPISSFADRTNNDSITVAEVSSFQLAETTSFRPNIAAFLNFAPDHLNYHKTTQNYLNSKLKIFKNQTQSDFAVLNADDKVVSKIKLPTSKVYYFSTKKQVNGCFVRGDGIYFRDTTKCVPGYLKAKRVASVSDVKLVGEHNLSNAVCAVCCAMLAGRKPEVIREKLSSFKPVAHRLQTVSTFGGITFINDSKATNPASAVCAIKSMTRPTILILGGSDKGLKFDDIFKIKNSYVKFYVFIGETKKLLASCATKHGITNYCCADTLKEAIISSIRHASSGDVVLLSPACASFDMFSGYEERGKCFCGIVRELKRN